MFWNFYVGFIIIGRLVEDHASATHREESEQFYEPSNIKFMITAPLGVSFTKEELHVLIDIIEQNLKKNKKQFFCLR